MKKSSRSGRGVVCLQAPAVPCCGEIPLSIGARNRSGHDRRVLGAVLFASFLLAAALGGCAYSPRADTAASAAQELSEAEARSVVAQWQTNVNRYVTSDDHGGAAALARLPTLRSPAVRRPGRIVFSALDIGASAVERDGHDVFGLLLGKPPGETGATYVFVVGTVDRSEFRPVAVVDVRIAVMSIRNGAVDWKLGDGSRASLARYRAAADPTSAPRFPADRDRFRLLDCPAAICVEETVSGARWVLPMATSAAPSASANEGLGVHAAVRRETEDRKRLE
jgi:hypothetical protein